MPLPANGTEWPPVPRRQINEHINRAAQRWSFQYLQEGYARIFRGAVELDNASTYRRLPVVADIAATAADLLFGEEARYNVDKGSQDRLEELLSSQVHNKILEAAETASALGGCYLRPVWDPGFQEEAILTVVQPQYAVPEWRWGKLNAVTFWRKVAEENAVTIWHLERHEEGVILHGLYRGSAGRLGNRIPLNNHPDTRGLPDRIDLPAGARLIVEYVPNVLPNRVFPNGGDGRPDMQGGEDILDDIDMTYSSWMRDLRLAKARLVVDAAYLQKDDGGNTYFDVDQEVYEALRRGSEDRVITPVQFNIRVDEHERTLLQLFERAIDHAGYSPGTFGMRIEGRAESGTALRVREGKTYHTTERKGRYFVPALTNVLEYMLRFKADDSGSRLTVAGTGDLRPAITLADPSVNDPTEVSQTIVALNTAQAVSQETKIRMAQVLTGLSDDDVEEEMGRIDKDKEAEMARAIESGTKIAQAKGTGDTGGRVGGSSAARAGGSRQPGQGPRG